MIIFYLLILLSDKEVELGEGVLHREEEGLVVLEEPRPPGHVQGHGPDAGVDGEPVAGRRVRATRLRGTNQLLSNILVT